MTNLQIKFDSQEVNVPFNTHCGVCEGSGIMYVADQSGEDFEAEYCTYCPEGLKAEMAGVGGVVGIAV